MNLQKFAVGFFLLVALVTFINSCSTPNNPSTPGTAPTMTFTPTFTQTPCPSSLGTTATGGSFAAPTGPQILAMAVTVSSPITVNSLSLDLLGSSGTTLVQAALYSDNSGPNTVIVSSQAQPIAASTGWNNLGVPATPLGAGVYWIALQTNGNLDIYVNTSGGQSFYSYTAGVSFTAGSFPTHMPTGAGNANNYSMYAHTCP